MSGPLSDLSAEDSVRDWVIQNQPQGWEEWEWHRYLCSIGMQLLQAVSDRLGVDVPTTVGIVNCNVVLQSGQGKAN